MKKNVLLISPRINNLFIDIRTQLENWGMEVDFIEDHVERYDPNYIRNEWHVLYDNRMWSSFYQESLDRKWADILSCMPYNKKYDYLLVIDGQFLSPYLFKELKSRNPNLWAANYLFDSTKSLYRFQKNFDFFDIVASFDRRDCKEYNILFLPIYWCEQKSLCPIELDIFGFGTYNKTRYDLFQSLDSIAEDCGMKRYIKLYCMKIESFRKYNIKQKIRKTFGLDTYITSDHYNSPLITHQLIPSTDFRTLIFLSRITIDSVIYNQDGMTARFMWALGAGKKIITTNANIMQYDCYDPKQVFVVDDITGLSSNDSLLSFLQTNFKPTNDLIDKIMPWRLDHWLMTLLNIEREMPVI